ncbi:MAG: hypothetical protein JO007_17215 [Alphaproteobacteria bacterium]|nr:hypothetical protein [Alphaproteobacteria bacterium]
MPLRPREAIVPAPRGWSPQPALARLYPAIAELGRAALPEIRDIENGLDHDEAAGCDTVRARQAIGELRWRLQYTGDAAAAARVLTRARAFASASASIFPLRDEQGSFGIGTEVWFLKLDASTDPMLADDFIPDVSPPRFLDRINHPDRLRNYLEGLTLSRLEQGIDHRKELNFATADLVRLILRCRPVGYQWHPGLEDAIRNFLAEWQDPATGFFGADYAVDGRRWRTADLSMTFHMARYLDGHIGHWERLIDTLLAIRDDRYPNGWLDDEGMTSHNNYDVAVLFSFGWPQMRADQRDRAREEIDRLLGWCLETAIAPEGTVMARAVGESIPESYYFTIAFLDTIGFFNPAKRFWTDRVFPQAPVLRGRLERRVLELHRNHPMVPMALARLHS